MEAVTMDWVLKIDAFLLITVNSYPSGCEHRHSHFAKRRRLPEAPEEELPPNPYILAEDASRSPAILDPVTP